MTRFRRSISCVTIAVLAAASVGGPAARAEAHDVAKVKRAIRRNWDGNDRRAIRVARCESSLDPKATSPSGTYLGLWQFSVETWKDYDGPGDDPRKVGPGKQTQVAWRLYEDRGWAPWPTCGAKGSAHAADVAGPEWTEVRRRGAVSDSDDRRGSAGRT